MKEYYFKVDGRIIADTDNEATNKLYELLQRPDITCYEILETEEVED